MKQNGLIGIIGNTLFIEPFYAGDHVHKALVNDHVKDDLIERGVPVFTHNGEIDAYLLGISYEELQQQELRWEQEHLERQRIADLCEEGAAVSDLPF